MCYKCLREMLVWSSLVCWRLMVDIRLAKRFVCQILVWYREEDGRRKKKEVRIQAQKDGPHTTIWGKV